MDVVPIDPTNAADLAQRLLSLQHAACAVEAALIGDDRIPPLHETIEELRALPLRWLAACDHGGRLVGAVAWVEDADVLDIDRLMVDGRASSRCRARARRGGAVSRRHPPHVCVDRSHERAGPPVVRAPWVRRAGRDRGRARPLGHPPRALPVGRTNQQRASGSPTLVVQDGVQGLARSGTEAIAREVRGRDQRTLPDLRWQTQDVGHLPFVGEVR